MKYRKFAFEVPPMAIPEELEEYVQDFFKQLKSTIEAELEIKLISKLNDWYTTHQDEVRAFVKSERERMKEHHEEMVQFIQELDKAAQEMMQQKEEKPDEAGPTILPIIKPDDGGYVN